MNFNQDFADFIILLNHHKVDYMVVGGYAMGLHGLPRYTGDLDIWINREERNVDLLLNVVRDFGGPLAEIDKNALMANATQTNRSPGISFGREPVRIEVLTSIDGVDFKDCFTRVQCKNISGLQLNYIHYNDLIKNKEASGRIQDQADAEALKRKGNYDQGDRK
jgi:hypothetical protein